MMSAKKKMEEKKSKNFHFVEIFICGFFVPFFLQTNRRPLPHYELFLVDLGATPLRALHKDFLYRSKAFHAQWAIF